MTTAAPAGHNSSTYEPSAVADGIRARVLELSLSRGGGYLSQACSSAEILSALFTRVMKLGLLDEPRLAPSFGGVPSRTNKNAVVGEAFNGPKLPHLDRFYLSPAHYCMALYAALIEVGRLAPESMAQFNRDGSTVEMIGSEHSPGMGMTTGSFGQAISQVAGIALARRMRGESGRTWLFMSDGEFDEGQVWEGLLFLAHQKLDRVGILVDVNGQQVDGMTKDIFDLGSLADKCRAFGADAVEVDGHDIEALAEAASRIGGGRPLVILANTDTARGMEVLSSRKPDLHYVGIHQNADKAPLERTLASLRERAGHTAAAVN
jgi:transketolase